MWSTIADGKREAVRAKTYVRVLGWHLKNNASAGDAGFGNHELKITKKQRGECDDILAA